MLKISNLFFFFFCHSCNKNATCGLMHISHIRVSKEKIREEVRFQQSAHYMIDTLASVSGVYLTLSANN